jgi:hypothetical protein
MPYFSLTLLSPKPTAALLRMTNVSVNTLRKLGIFKFLMQLMSQNSLDQGMSQMETASECSQMLNTPITFRVSLYFSIIFI